MTSCTDHPYVPVPVAEVVQPSFVAVTDDDVTQLPQVSTHCGFDETTIERIKSLGFTDGMVESLKETVTKFPYRFWVLDNSGSMLKTDGYCTSSSKRMVQCTRWEEIKECVNYHINLAALLLAPTNFRLLNNPGHRVGGQKFAVASGKEEVSVEVDQAMNIMSKISPYGGTPLTNHVYNIRDTIAAMKDDLEREGKKVGIVLATDGLPTDASRNGFVQSLRSLEQLPVWLVIRLSTNEDNVINFYNDLDNELELSMDILDDFCGEAAEVYKYNPWINYGLPLHRLREMGCHNRLLDIIDERALTHDELQEFCLFIFGLGKCDGLEDPTINWDKFLENVNRIMKKEDLQFNPIKKKMTDWIDVNELHIKYGNPNSIELLYYHRESIFYSGILLFFLLFLDW